MTVTTPPASSSRYRIYEAASSRPQTRAATRPGRDDRSRRPASTATPPPQGSAPTGPAATVPRDGVVRSASPGSRAAWPARQDRDGDRARVAVDGADAGDAGRLRDVLPHRCQWPPATARGRRGAPSLKLVPVPRVRRPRVRRDPGRPERGREALIPAGAIDRADADEGLDRCLEQEGHGVPIVDGTTISRQSWPTSSHA